MIGEGKEWTEYQGPIWLDGYLHLKEQSVAPGTPKANYLSVYAKDSGGISTLCIKNDAGNELCLPTTAGTLVTGTGVNTRVAFWTGVSTLGNDADFTYDSTNN